MPLQDVSNDHSMMDWLRQSGHGHLLDSGNHDNNYPPPKTSSSSSPPPPLFGSSGGGSGNYGSSSPQMNIPNQSSTFPPTSNYGGAGSPLLSSGYFNPQSMDHQSSPLNLSSSPTQFLGSNMNQQQLDADIEVTHLS